MPDVESLQWPKEEEEPVYTPEYAPYAPYAEMVERYSGEYGVPKNFARAMMEAESTFQPGAVSSQGATGLLQIMPRTAKGLGFEPEDMKDPDTNIHAGVKMMSELLDRFGSISDATAAYNWGPTAMSRWIRAGRPEGVMPSETRRHVDKVLSNIRKYENPESDLPGMWMGGPVGRSRYR